MVVGAKFEVPLDSKGFGEATVAVREALYAPHSRRPKRVARLGTIKMINSDFVLRDWNP